MSKHKRNATSPKDSSGDEDKKSASASQSALANHSEYKNFNDLYEQLKDLSNDLSSQSNKGPKTRSNLSKVLEGRSEHEGNDESGVDASTQEMAMQKSKFLASLLELAKKFLSVLCAYRDALPRKRLRLMEHEIVRGTIAEVRAPFGERKQAMAKVFDQWKPISNDVDRIINKINALVQQINTVTQQRKLTGEIVAKLSTDIADIKALIRHNSEMLKAVQPAPSSSVQINDANAETN